LTVTIARRVAVFGVSALLAGCAVLDKEPVPIGERGQVVEPAPADSSIGRTVAALAKRHVGAPYRWGGASPSGFDCSGFVCYVYGQVGLSLPHNAAKQYRLGSPVTRDGLEPGDLVFFDGLRHNGIYVGGGRFIHARQTGRGVTIARLDEAWYASHWSGARRLEPPMQAAWGQER
jgi:cell wall-associated NlpC family hydrolase